MLYSAKTQRGGTILNVRFILLFEPPFYKRKGIFFGGEDEMDAEDPYSNCFKIFYLRCLISSHITKENVTTTL